MPAVIVKHTKNVRVPRSTRAAAPKTVTLWDRIGHLAGSIDGPGNLSALSKTMPGYGRSRSR